jgi:chromosome segregation ATPase
MRALIGAVACVGFVLGVAAVQAQERKAEGERPPPDPAVVAERQAQEQQFAQWRQQMGQVEQGLWSVKMRLGLAGGGRDKGGIKNEEVAKLAETAETARKAMEDKTKAVLKADAEAGPIMTQLEDLQKKMAELQQQQRDLEKQLGPVAQRLGIAAGRGDKIATAPTDPELATLRADAEAAHKALEDKVTELIKADAEGAKLLQDRDALNAQFEAARQQRGEGKGERGGGRGEHKGER